MSRDLIERAEALKADLEGKVRTFEVPELGERGKPLVIHVYPITTKELQRIIGVVDAIERAAMSIDVRAKDADGRRIFINERQDIMRGFPPALILKIARRINEDMESLFTDDGAIDNVDGIDAAGK